MSDEGVLPPADGLSLPPPPGQRRGGIVRRSFAVAREHAALAGATALAVVLPIALASAFAARGFVEPSGGGGTGPPPENSIFLDAIEGLVITPWAVAAALLVVLGRATAVGEAVGAALGRLPRALGAMVVSGLVTTLPAVPAILLFSFSIDEALSGMGPGMTTVGPEDVPSGMALAGLLFMLALLPVAFLGLSLGLSVPLAVADELGPIAACKASWRRMRGQRLRLLGGMFGTVLPVLIAVLLLSLPIGMLGLAFGPGGAWIVQGTIDALLIAGVTVPLVSVYAVVRADSAPTEPLPPGDPEGRWQDPPADPGQGWQGPEIR